MTLSRLTVSLPFPASRPNLLDVAGPGQAALAEGLVAMGFKLVEIAEAASRLSRGESVLVHGWRDSYLSLLATSDGDPSPRGGETPRFIMLWHSGWSGSDAMGEHETLATALAIVDRGLGRLLWLERDDAPPRGARHLAPVWDPDLLVRPPRPPVPRRVALGLAARWAAPAKNLLGMVAAVSRVDGLDLHVGESTLLGPRGALIHRLLTHHQFTVHPMMPREDVRDLLQSSNVLVHASLSDTWPFLALEAVYGGTPVVGSSAISWMRRLPSSIRAIAAPDPTSTTAIERAVRAITTDPDLREEVLVAEREHLDRLWRRHRAEAHATLTDLGFAIP